METHFEFSVIKVHMRMMLVQVLALNESYLNVRGELDKKFLHKSRTKSTDAQITEAIRIVRFIE